ncbi:MAG: substrate-binding domain-containing protein, partial [Pseudomonadota bacterium]|nr:substrate-binding domain-containing protein [Pseudomonadota bacterium]
MMKTLQRFGTVAAAAVGSLMAPAVMAAEITVLSGGAVEPGLKPVLAAFETATGHKVQVTFNTAPQIAKRIGAGEAWDVVIAPAAVLDGLAKNASAGGGQVGSERASLGRVGIGVAVRPGAPVPQIADAESLKRSLLEADSVVFNRASTGVAFENVLRRLDIAAPVDAKAHRYADGAGVMEHLLKGQGREIGVGAMTEILLYRDRGLVLVGPLPPALQNFTTYVAAVPAT